MIPRWPSTARLSIAVFCAALMLVISGQFVIVTVDRVAHHVGTEHTPTSLAGTVIDHDAIAVAHAAGQVNNQSPAPVSGLDHDHVDDIALGYIAPAILTGWLPVDHPAQLDFAIVHLVCGLSGCILERPPKLT